MCPSSSMMFCLLKNSKVDHFPRLVCYCFLVSLVSVRRELKILFFLSASGLPHPNSGGFKFSLSLCFSGSTLLCLLVFSFSFFLFYPEKSKVKFFNLHVVSLLILAKIHATYLLFLSHFLSVLLSPQLHEIPCNPLEGGK